MTNTDEILLDLATTPDADIAARISRALIESAFVLSTIVRAQAVGLRVLDDAKRAEGGDRAGEASGSKKSKANTGAATRELVSLVLAASRTMEMKHKLDAVAGPADKLTRDEARKLLELTDAQIDEFIAQRRAARQGEAADRRGAGADPAFLAGDRS
jgi:hypothetical protein